MALDDREARSRARQFDHEKQVHPWEFILLKVTIEPHVTVPPNLESLS